MIDSGLTVKLFSGMLDDSGSILKLFDDSGSIVKLFRGTLDDSGLILVLLFSSDWCKGGVEVELVLSGIDVD